MYVDELYISRVKTDCIDHAKMIMKPTIPTRMLVIEVAEDSLGLLFLVPLSTISHRLPTDPELQLHTPGLVQIPFSHEGSHMAGWTQHKNT